MRNARKRRLLGLMTVTLALVFAAHADEVSYFTHDLPEPDRAEVALVTEPETSVSKATLNATQARKLAALVRAQTWFGKAGSCRDAQYVLRFYSGKKLLAEEAICFNCGCLAPLGFDHLPKIDPQSFDAQTPKAIELHHFIEKLVASHG
jgi:hypothetical protein